MTLHVHRHHAGKRCLHPARRRFSVSVDSILGGRSGASQGLPGVLTFQWKHGDTRHIPWNGSSRQVNVKVGLPQGLHGDRHVFAELGSGEDPAVTSRALRLQVKPRALPASGRTHGLSLSHKVRTRILTKVLGADGSVRGSRASLSACTGRVPRTEDRKRLDPLE